MRATSVAAVVNRPQPQQTAEFRLKIRVLSDIWTSSEIQVKPLLVGNPKNLTATYWGYKKFFKKVTQTLFPWEIFRNAAELIDPGNLFTADRSSRCE